MFTTVYKALLKVRYDVGNFPATADAFGVIDPYVTPTNFPAQRSGDPYVLMHVVNFKSSVDAEDVFTAFARGRVKHPCAHELVTLGMHNDMALDSLLKTYSRIVCLCEPWRRSGRIPVVPALSQTNGIRKIELDDSFSWSPRCLFLSIVSEYVS